MDFVPYATQSINEDDLAAVRQVLTSGWLTQGPAVPRFEEAFAQRHGVAHAVAVCNATAGLHIGCLALNAGPGTAVWTSPNSFVASSNAALYCGADVDFVDIDPVTRNMCVRALAQKLEKAEHENRLPSIVIPVHFGGLACDLAPMRALADRYGFAILEDASHAVGASYNGRAIGSRYAEISVFSFHPVKVLTTGEGGMVTTQNAGLARRLQLLRSHGITRDASEMQNPDVGLWHYEQHSLGFNHRMTDIQAALGLSQLQRLDGFHAAREHLADRYDRLLGGCRCVAQRVRPVQARRLVHPGTCMWSRYCPGRVWRIVLRYSPACAGRGLVSMCTMSPFHCSRITKAWDSGRVSSPWLKPTRPRPYRFLCIRP